MFSTIIVGLVFLVIFGFAAKKAITDLKKGKCAGCSSCDSKKKSSCCDIES